MHGFYFFAINPNPKVRPNTAYKGNAETFRIDWVEVEVRVEDDKSKKAVRKEPTPSATDAAHSDGSNMELPEFLSENMDKFTQRQKESQVLSRSPFYKSVTFDVDQSNRCTISVLCYCNLCACFICISFLQV